RPTQVLCSSARRTRETLEGVAPGGEAMIDPELYSASCGELVARLQRVPEEARSVMVIGHNPAVQMLVLRLADPNGAKRRELDDEAVESNLLDVQRKFPTGALATLTFDCAWQDLTPGCATLA